MRSQERLSALLEAVTNSSTILILPHNNPDPDSIASMLALGHLLGEIAGVKSLFAYHGIIGRAENRALVRYLDPPLRPMASFDRPELAPWRWSTRNPARETSRCRPMPASSSSSITMLCNCPKPSPILLTFVLNWVQRPRFWWSIFRQPNWQPSPPLATALFYGIKTTTMGLGRNANPTDTKAYYYLQSRIDVAALAKIEHAQVPANYFRSFDTALRRARIFDHVVISYLGLMDYPDLTAEMADLFLRLERAKWVICMGVYENILILSVRTRGRDGQAGQLIQAIIEGRGSYGGHGTVAGGQVPLYGEDPVQLADRLSEKALRYLKISLTETGETLA